MNEFNTVSPPLNPRSKTGARMGSNEMMDQRLEDIHLNPIAEGFVDVREAWLYSSARDYVGIATGSIQLIYIEYPRR